MKRKKVGEIGVDSGQVVVCDPCYIDSMWQEEAFDPSKKSSTFSYNGACHTSCTKGGAGQLGRHDAVACSTAWGDGLYPVYVEYNSDGRPTRLVVEFEPDEEDDQTNDSSEK